MLKSIHIPTKFQLFEKTGKPFQYENKEFQLELRQGEALVKILLSTINLQPI